MKENKVKKDQRIQDKEIVEHFNLSEIDREAISKQRQSIGKMLRRSRLSRKGKNGEPLEIKMVAKVLGCSAVAVSNAERGQFGNGLMFDLLNLYHDMSFLEVLNMLDTANNKRYLSGAIISRIGRKSEGLLANEFLRAVTTFPDREFEVTYQAYADLQSMGFATRFEVYKKRTRYYAATIEYVEKDAPIKEEWKIPKGIVMHGAAGVDKYSMEFLKWANSTLINAIKEHPQYGQDVTISD